MTLHFMKGYCWYWLTVVIRYYTSGLEGDVVFSFLQKKVLDDEPKTL